MSKTIYDVAKLASVSTATVSRVINRTGNVTPKTEEKVKKAMEELNFTPNSLAQSFAKMKSKTLGFILSMPYLSNSDDYYMESVYFTELFRGINRIAQKRGYSLLIINMKENFQAIISEFLDQKKIDGLIIGAQPIDTEMFRKVIKQKKPIVYIGQVKEFNKGLHVYAQYRQYIKNVFDYFISNSHTHIVYYGAKKEDELKRILLDYKEIKIEYVNAFISNNETHQKLRQCFNRDERPTAIFYEGLSGIQPVISILNELKLSVPEDVSIISVEHRKGLGENFFPPITNVYVPVYEMGKTATTTLIDYIEGQIENYDHQFDLDSVIIERKSVK